MASKKRYFAYDFVRVIAMFMVIAVHARPGAREQAWTQWYDSYACAILFQANALFFMMSGRLNMRIVEDDKLGTYYYRKFTRVLLPTLVYMFVQTTYGFVSSGAAIEPVSLIKTFTINAIEKYVLGVYWFVMALFGMLLAAPILAPAFTNMTRGRRNAFVILFLLWGLPQFLLCRTSHGFSWSYYLCDNFGAFLLGHILELDKLADRPWHQIFVPTALLVTFSAALLYKGFPHYPVDSNTPMYYLASVGTLIMLYKLGRKLPEMRVVSFVAKYSFGVYMCHLTLMRLILPHMPGLGIVQAHLWMTGATFLVALAFTVAVDTVIVHPLQFVCDAAWKHHEERRLAANSLQS